MSPAAGVVGDQSLRIVPPHSGSFTPSGCVTLTRVGFCFLRKREILASRLRQKLSFPPPVVKRDPCAYEEHHHDNGNYHPCGPARGGLCSSCSRCIRGTGSRR